MFDSTEYMREHQHEQLITRIDPKTGLVAKIAIHNTRLGRAIGGVRLAEYASVADAERDVLRLAEGMTYKTALAGVAFRGAKAVIIGDGKESDPILRAARFRTFGTFVDALDGLYVTAEDVGTTPTDMAEVRKRTRHVAGLPIESGGGGDPSPMTAEGIIAATKALVQEVFGTDTLKGLTFAIQGLGKVGARLAERLIAEGGTVIAADVRPELAHRMQEKLGIQIVEPDAILTTECDVLAPCALGAVFSERNIEKLRCRIIAGCANNQLEEEWHGEALHNLGIVYGVDYVLNAGGLINCADEFEPGGYNYDRALAKTLRIADTVREMVRIAHENNISTASAARRMARKAIALAPMSRLI